MQCRSTRIDAQVVVGAHGTLKNWITKRALAVNHVRILVLDEADEMLKVGNSQREASEWKRPSLGA